MSDARVIVSSRSEPDHRNKELFPISKVSTFQPSKSKKAILFLFCIFCEKFRSYIGLHKFPEGKLLGVFFFEKKTIEFLLCNRSCNRCTNKILNSNMIIMKRTFIVSETVIEFPIDHFIMMSTCHTLKC